MKQKYLLCLIFLLVLIIVYKSNKRIEGFKSEQSIRSHIIPNDTFSVPSTVEKKYPGFLNDLKARFGGHETRTYRLIISKLKNLPDNTVIIDAGAHIGDLALIIAMELKKLNKNIKLLAIDPDANKIDFIRSIALRNELNNIEYHVMGLGDRSIRAKEGCLHRHSGAHCLIEDAQGDKIIKKLDDVVKGRQISLLHFDLEGYEHKAFIGAEQALKNRRVPFIIYEYEHVNDTKIFDLLNTYGYKKDSWVADLNYLFVPK